MRTYSGNITRLEPNEVFVFGCNEAGFHGAGAAGYATFGEAGNVWRKHGYDEWPQGTKGMWTEKGVIGPQQGTVGKSFGVVTILRPGQKRSVTPDFTELFACCEDYPHFIFYLAQEGVTGLNGWTPEEMADFLLATGDIPDNLYIHESFAPFVSKSKPSSPSA